MGKMHPNNQGGAPRTTAQATSVFNGFPGQSHKKIKSRSVKPAMSSINPSQPKQQFNHNKMSKTHLHSNVIDGTH